MVVAEPERVRGGGAVAVGLVVAVVFGACLLGAGPVAAAVSCPSGFKPGDIGLSDALTCKLVDFGNGAPFGGVSNPRDSTETVTVPGGVSVMHLDAVGGVGFGGCTYPDVVSGDLAVQPGEQLTLVAGGAGGHGKQPSGAVANLPGVGGFGGGGSGGANDYGGAGDGGGGGSFVFGPKGDVLLVSGGTGGQWWPDFGSGGGFSHGGAGIAWDNNAQTSCDFSQGTTTSGGGPAGGQGATGSAAGKGGSGAPGGSAGQDGTGPATSPTSLGIGGQGAPGGGASGTTGGGGGGGGYYGGGGGGGGGDLVGSGGGAGSDYHNSAQVTNFTVTAKIGFEDGYVNGEGMVVLSIPSIPALVVNSTGNEDNTATDLASGVCNVNLSGPQACTLRAAIEVANHVGGAVVTFDVPATLNGVANTFDPRNHTVPQIQDPSGGGMPAITAPTTIDGTSQPGAGRVELSGTSGSNIYRGTPPPTTGLVLSAPGAAVKGLVINGYSDGIVLRGGRDAVQEDWLGTDVTGTAAEPNPLGTNTSVDRLILQIGVDLESGGNVVGQSVFADHWTLNPHQARPAAAIYDSVGGNTIQANWVGVVPNTRNPLIDPGPGAGALPGWAGLIVTAGADTIGGASAALGNVVATESSVSGSSVVQGNTFLGELHADGKVQIGGPTGTPGTGPGNVFTETRWAGSTRLLEISGGVVQGNRFSDSGAPAIVAEGGVLIGGATPNLGNEITRVATDPGSQGGLPGFDAAITLAFSQNRVENNVISDNGGYAAVQVDLGHGNTITRNVMSGNPEGIVLGRSYVLDGQYRPTLNDPGPNDYQPYPVLSSAEAGSAGSDITGLYQEPASFRLVHSITVDLYAMKACNRAPQGLVFLGSRQLSVALALSQFSLSFGPVPAGRGYDAVTATATAPDGSTSEFSPCFTIGSHPDPWTRLGVAPSSTTVAISTTSAPQGAREPVIARAPAKGHGNLLLVCPVSAVKYCRGTFKLGSIARGAQPIAHGSFKIIPGYVDPIKLTVTGKLLTGLQRHHKLRLRLTTDARDAAKRHNHKTRTITITLQYKIVGAAG